MARCRNSYDNVTKASVSFRAQSRNVCKLCELVCAVKNVFEDLRHRDTVSMDVLSSVITPRHTLIIRVELEHLMWSRAILHAKVTAFCLENVILEGLLIMMVMNETIISRCFPCDTENLCNFPHCL